MSTHKDRVYGESVIPISKTVTVSTTLLPGENTIFASGTITVTLPALVDCVGQIFSVECTAGSSNITVAAADGTIYGPTSAWSSDTLTADGNVLVVQNVNGYCWHVLTDITT